jgi:hypothetical protein
VSGSILVFDWAEHAEGANAGHGWVHSDPRGRGWRHGQFAGSRAQPRAPVFRYLACDTRFCPAGLPRHCTLLRVPDLKGQGLVDNLLSIAGRIGEKAVLILSSDLPVVAVARGPRSKHTTSWPYRPRHGRRAR